jgi:hypothetical protein
MSGDISISLRVALRREPVVVEPVYRVAWDDETPSWDYMSRTQSPGWTVPDNPPAVYRLYPEPREQSGDYRVDLASPYDWKPAIIAVNGGDVHKWEYLVDPQRATYNQTGWSKQAYLTMSGNRLKVLRRFGEWVQFETLKPTDVTRAMGMTIETHPEYVHRFTCVSWRDGRTVHIESTGTPRGQVLFFLVTKEGYGWMPARNVIQDGG